MLIDTSWPRFLSQTRSRPLLLPKSSQLAPDDEARDVHAGEQFKISSDDRQRFIQPGGNFSDVVPDI
jgi:hypothetical protein